MRDVIEEATRHADRMATEGLPVTADDLGFDFDNPQDALRLYRQAVRQVAAAQKVKRAAAETLSNLLGVGGAACYGNQIVRYKLGSTEKCHNPEGALDALARLLDEGNADIRTIVNPNNLKVTGMPAGFRDTFYIKTDDDEPTLTDVPRDKAAKFLHDMVDGDILIDGELWRTT